ncbi:MAG: sodium:proton antiporter [Proteobacteria bacterium]|nr:sodium:proton antiporter [Pseudomonadota bacterium]
MATLTSLPFILFLVVVVTAIAENVNVPYPLLLVITGLIVGFIPGIPSWHPPSDIVLALFLPPILFSAARLISWQDVKQHIGIITSLSIFLVLFSAIAIAWVLCWLIPGIHFATGLILGAIIAPTDVIAAHSILTKMNVPRHITRTIKVESLFNDACGIVLYKSALLLAVGKSLTVPEIGHQILFIGAGGIMIGLLFAYISGIIIKQFLSHSENHLPIIMSLILAYVSYWFAEKLGASGVLAVVAAGLYHKKTERSVSASIRIAEKTVWDTLIFFLNGLIFISIGTEFPNYLHSVSYLPIKNLLMFSFATIICLFILRLVWVGITISIDQHRWQMKTGSFRQTTKAWKKSLIVSWAGMRGLVSLALAIALPPLTLSNPAVPIREIIIFLTIITILFTLIAQGLSLRPLIKILAVSKNHEDDMKKIRDVYQQLTEKALVRINSNDFNPSHPDLNLHAKDIVVTHYNNRLRHALSPSKHLHHHKHAESLLARMLQFERDMLLKMRENDEISEEIYLKILLKLDRDEVSFSPYK